jgi:hypothetical protein
MEFGREEMWMLIPPERFIQHVLIRFVPMGD